MKTLFISSGNSKNGISPIVKNQGISLEGRGVTVDYFTIQGKGLLGYLKNILPLRRHLKKHHYDIIHAHYSLTAFAATLAGCRPLVVSLMGSDIRLGFIFKKLTKLFAATRWHALIVKSEDMRHHLQLEDCHIIPNGIDTTHLISLDKGTSQQALSWNPEKKHLLFAANPSRQVKNYPLFSAATAALNFGDAVDCHALEDVPHQDIPAYFNAADVVVLTSLWEGSPNVIKEAMACNCPIVATDVGDIAWLFGDEPGHFLTSFEPDDVAEKIRQALEFAQVVGKTNGRQRIIQLGLDSQTVARRIVDVYRSVLS